MEALQRELVFSSPSSAIALPSPFHSHIFPDGDFMEMEEIITIKPKPRAFTLRTFGDPGCPGNFSGAFRDNIRQFLRECGHVQDYNVQGMPVWCTMIVDEKTGVVIPLYIIEEAVRHSSRPFCDYCRCSGWSHHFVSTRRYHVIIPSDEDWDERLGRDAFDLHTHLLHGLIHCNGFGHLLVINGRDGGSKYISGRDIMSLWDRICTSLRTREVTVEDLSRKKSMDLRLLLGVAYGLPWFSRWGYKYHLGSFRVTEEDYYKAVDSIGSQHLDLLLDEFQSTGRERELRRILFTYRHQSEDGIDTVSDLVRHMLQSKNLPEPSSKPVQSASQPRRAVPHAKPFEEVAAELDSRWSERRLLEAAEVVAEALHESGGMLTRQEVRDVARRTIGDTGLLDFVLKSLGDSIISGYVIRRTQNPSTRVLEFSIERSVMDWDSDQESYPEEAVTRERPLKTRPSLYQVERDTAWVYKNVLLRRKEAAETALHGKRWVKSWPLRDDDDDHLRFLCQWMPCEGDVMPGELTRPLPPPEVVVMPPHAAVVDLRLEAERALRDTYCVMEGFVSTRLEGVVGEEWDPLFGAVESGATVWVRGLGLDLRGDGEMKGRQLRYEGGADNWTVECACGATDDDGERMVACDICEVWQHTKCAGIDDGDAVPKLFLCVRCAGTVMINHANGIM